MQIHAGSPGGRTHVGVLPLRLSGMTDQERDLGSVVAEEISLALSHFRVVIVVSPIGLAQFARSGHDEAAIRLACGVDFLVRGGLQRAGGRWRAWLRLIDLRRQHRIVWAHRFDGGNDDFLSSLDEITTVAVGQIIPQILLTEAERIAIGSLETATAYDLVLHALPFMRRLDRTAFLKAGDYLAWAIERDSDYSPAYSWYAFWLMMLAAQGWVLDCNAVMRKAARFAAKAVLLDPGDAFAVTMNAHVSTFMHRHLSVAAALYEKALALNPNISMAWALSASTYSSMGELAEAEKRYDRYRKFGVFDPTATFFAGLSMLIHLSKRDYEAVIAAGRKATEMTPALRSAYKPYLSALGHLGRIEESALVYARLLSIEPDFSVDDYIATCSLEREIDRQHLAKGLRLAGAS